MKILVAALLLLAACSKPAEEPVKPAETSAPSAAPTAAPATGAMSEKEKALANPYPNDLGPDRLSDAVLAAYPADKKKGYDLLVVKCAQCHTPARPLNSRFVEVSASELAALDKGLLADKSVRQVETGVWNRYVKRMMSKPGCAIASAEGKAIWEFLAYDGKTRKLGANAAAWEAHRKKLLAEFKTKHAQRYEELAAASDL